MIYIIKFGREKRSSKYIAMYRTEMVPVYYWNFKTMFVCHLLIYDNLEWSTSRIRLKRMDGKRELGK